MKNTVLILFCTFSGIITLTIIMAVYGRINRSIELKSNLSSAVEESIKNTMNNQKYEVGSEKEFVADIVEKLVYAIDGKSDIQIDIYQCNKEKGMISLAERFMYMHPNGRIGSVEEEKTVIYNQAKKELPIEKYKVKFFVGEECYKSFEVCKNSIITLPAQPEIEGKMFNGWLNAEGVEIDFSNPIIEDSVYYADIQ